MCEEVDGEGLEYHSSHGITQLRFPGDAFPVKNLPDIPDPLPMGLLAAHRRAKDAPPPKLPKPKKKAPAKKTAKKKAKR